MCTQYAPIGVYTRRLIMNKQENQSTDKDYVWEKCFVEEIELSSEHFINALSFVFENSKVSIYRLGDKWLFTVWNKNGFQTTSKKFNTMLGDITPKKSIELKSVLNAAGIADKNAPKMLMQMSEKMAEHIKEIEKPIEDREEPTDFFTRVKNPSWFNALRTMKKSLYIVDPVPYVMGMTTFISNKIPDGEQLWLFIVGPSGIGKTEFSRYLIPGEKHFNAWVFQMSEITSKTLISGKEDTSDLLPEIDNKMLLFSDFTVMISKKPDEIADILSQLREMYDGQYMKGFGSGAGVKHYQSRFSILAGVTNKIDIYQNQMSSLGERFIKVRFNLSTTDFSEKIVEAAFHNIKMTPEDLKFIQDEMLSMYENFDPDKLAPMGKEWYKYIMECAMITANLRIPVERDQYLKGRPVILMPHAEEATRLVKVYKKMAQVLCYVLEKPEFDLEVLSYIYRVTLDSPEALRLHVLRNITFMGQELDEVCDKIDLPRPIIVKILEELKYARLITIGSEVFSHSNDEGTALEESETEILYALNKDSPVLGYIRDVELALGALPEDQIHHNGMGISGLDILKGMTDFSFKATEEEIRKAVDDQIKSNENIPDEEEISFDVEAMINQWNEEHSEEHLDPNQESDLYEMEVHGFSKEEIEAKLKEMDDIAEHLYEP